MRTLPFVFALSGVLSGVLSNAALAQQTGMVHTQEVDLAYWVYGEGTQPVIVANGGPGLSHVYMMQNDVWERIAKGRKIVFYDQRGTGKSTRVSEGAPQNRFSLVGDSYGGLLAMAYAAAHPAHVERLVLSDSAAPALKDTIHVLQQVFPDVMEKRSADPKQQLIEHFRMLFYSEEKRDEYLAKATDLGSSPQVGAAVNRATRNLDLTPELPKFHFPTLVITGRYDMNVAPLTAWKIYKAIPGAQFVVFAKSGHLPSFEEPDRYVEVLDGFLGHKN
jgi:proline iminopeptidase